MITDITQYKVYYGEEGKRNRAAREAEIKREEQNEDTRQRQEAIDREKQNKSFAEKFFSKMKGTTLGDVSTITNH
jgi:nucleosome binding factor SPN SPT16 subunit